MPFTPNPGFEDEIKSDPGVLAQLEQIGEQIAADIPGASVMGSAEPGRYGTPQVEVQDDGVLIYTDGPFAAIAEWGGAFSGPDFAFRSTAAAYGDFEEH